MIIIDESLGALSTNGYNYVSKDDSIITTDLQVKKA